jgi:release factor glutamine methyltransferase
MESTYDWVRRGQLSKSISCEKSVAVERWQWQRRILGRSWLALQFRLFGQRRHRRLVLEQVQGIPLLVLPEVFNPTLFHTSGALVRVLPGTGTGAGTLVLDMGSGSGVGAVAAARLGARVVAVDIAGEAVRCTRINALLNGMETRIEVRQGDLFEPVRGERFDLVLFNPPYFRGAPREPWELAWRSEGVLDRFAEGLPEVLTPGGRALLVVSSETVGVAEALERFPLRSRRIWERAMLSERLSVLEWRPVEGKSG